MRTVYASSLIKVVLGFKGFIESPTLHVSSEGGCKYYCPHPVMAQMLGGGFLSNRPS